MDKTNDEKKYCVYRHVFPNGKVYVGQTCKKPEYRWGIDGNGYKAKNKKGEYSQPYMAHAIDKYGWENVIHEILFGNLTKQEANRIEQICIILFRSKNPLFGYNLSNGGDGQESISEETKRKMSENTKGEKNPMFGVSPKDRMDEDTYNQWRQKLKNLVESKEFKQNMRDKNIGKKYSDEVNMKKSNKGDSHPMYGKHHTKEAKEKIGNANRGKHDSEETKQKKRDAMTGETLRIMKMNQPNRTPIMCVETGQVFISIKEASEKMGISYSQINKCLNNLYKYDVQKYHFIKINKQEEI